MARLLVLPLPESKICGHATLAAQEWESTDDNHEVWFFGSGDLPRWLGYSFGFRLVERFLSEPAGSRASKLAVRLRRKRRSRPGAGFSLTPGYETYAGLGWYGVIAPRPRDSFE